MNDRYGTDINIEKVKLEWNGDIVVDGVLIRDDVQDTLIVATRLQTSILSYSGLIASDLDLGDTTIEDLQLKIVKRAGEDQDNLSIFSKKFSSGDTNSTTVFTLDAPSVQLNNAYLSYTDYNNAGNPVYLEITELNGRADDLSVEGSNVAADLRGLRFRESRDLDLQELSGDLIYSDAGITLDDYTIKTQGSELAGDLEIETPEGWSDFNNAVSWDIRFDNSVIANADIKKFYDGITDTGTTTLTGQLVGPLNNFRINDVNSETTQGIALGGDLQFVNLMEDQDNFRVSGHLDYLTTTRSALANYLPTVLGNTLPPELAKLGLIKSTGTFEVTPNTLTTDMVAITSQGRLEADVFLGNLTQGVLTYKGDVKTQNFNLGAVVGVSDLGRLTADLNLDGRGTDQATLSTAVQGTIQRVEFRGYPYSNIVVNGALRQPVFNGKLSIDDPNVKLDFEGLVDASGVQNQYDFVADIEYANLAKLNLFTRDSIARLQGRVVMDMRGTNLDDVVGEIRFLNASYENENDEYVFDDFDVISKFEGDRRQILIDSPDILTGTIEGNFEVAQVGNLFANAAQSIYSNFEAQVPTEGQDLSFDLKIDNKIVELFFPQVQLGEGTTLSGEVNSSTNSFKLNVVAPRASYNDIVLDELDLQIDTKNPLFNTFLKIESVDGFGYPIEEFRLVNKSVQDTLFFRSEFSGGANATDEFKLSNYYTINDARENVIGLQRSEIEFNDRVWTLNKERAKKTLVLSRDFSDLKLDSIKFTHENQTIGLAGVMRGDTYLDAGASFDNVRLATILPKIDSLAVRGGINGFASLQRRNGAYVPTSDIVVDDIAINDVAYGDLSVQIEGNEALNAFLVDAELVNGKLKSLDIDGELDLVGDQTSLALNARMRDFDLSALSPLGGEALDRLRGLTTGTATIGGTLSAPEIDGQLLVKNGGMRLPYLNLDMDFQNPARITMIDGEFDFGSIQVTDTAYGTTAQIEGAITHDNFTDWGMGLALQTDRFLVLNTKYSEEALYYGTAFVSGTADINGPLSELVIDANVKTEDDTTFIVPISDSVSLGDNSVIYFLSPEEKYARLNGEEIVIEDRKGLTLNLDLEVTPVAEVEVVIDQTYGSTLRARGNGNLLIRINTTGKFEMYGNYLATEGALNYKYGGIVAKNFNLLEDGSISWDGSPYEANINVAASYTTLANPSILLESNTINRRIPTQVILRLNGELLAPNIDYEIQFPTAGSSVESELQYRLEDRQARELQALSLVATGTFFSNAIAAQAVTGNLVETASSVLNGVFSDDNDKVQVGVDYRAGANTPDSETSDRFGITLQSQITDRISVNGTVGVPVGGGVSEQNSVVGDVSVDILLNEEGTLRAQFFNRESDIQLIGERQGYEQGAGLTYSVDFNSFQELWAILFKGKKEDDQVIPADSTPVNEFKPDHTDFTPVKPSKAPQRPEVPDGDGN